jgi:hypothetical protein
MRQLNNNKRNQQFGWYMHAMNEKPARHERLGKYRVDMKQRDDRFRGMEVHKYTYENPGQAVTDK